MIQLNENKESNESVEDFFSTDIGSEPKIDFDTTKIVVNDGSAKTIDKVEAVRQWIVKFCSTEQDAYPIYLGTGFGTRFKRLYGKKRIGYGYEEAEIERDFREGLTLCPAIMQVTDFKLKKIGSVLNIFVQVELYEGELVDLTIENAYEIKG